MPFGVVERAPGEYLVVGTRDPRVGDPAGWAMGLTDDPEAAVATPTATPTPSPTPTEPPATTDSPPASPDGDGSSIPGFSASAAAVSVGAGALLRALRTDR